MTYKLSAVIEREDPWYVALCPELGVASQGETLEKALANLEEAVTLYLETADPSEIHLPSHPPFLTTLDVAT
ncbi:MAG: type II toxin-antitoxin system HicB family antitoxin [Candidatus Omnitrophica bacterium]|nr:type II toxin-antitoxin system HicB family antitoxin [Candidatus Omnitrophota bacterium]MBI2174149.1 type II toxin-antitoxin system HicB family antitoxin [Candidatus Omnitrophota bacterium]MBI3010142.1 type II toxin-antitoxin system HicB family antitoxin [Candidatus Omnitrophota bacterium]